MAHPKYVVNLNELENIKQIECVYPLTAGITSRILRKSIDSALTTCVDLPEWIPEDIINKNGWLIIEDIPFRAKPIWEVINYIVNSRERSFLIKTKNSYVFLINKKR